MSKPIEPVEIRWGNNVVNTITSLEVVIIQDDLSNSCSLFYKVSDQNNTPISTGNMVIGGQDYQDWNGNNNYPYQFVANTLGLTLI